MNKIKHLEKMIVKHGFSMNWTDINTGHFKQNKIITIYIYFKCNGKEYKSNEVTIYPNGSIEMSPNLIHFMEMNGYRFSKGELRKPSFKQINKWIDGILIN